MASYLAVHHPVDPSAPEFDFWGWRIERRAVAERLRDLSGPAGGRREELIKVADALEAERFGEKEATLVRSFVADRGYRVTGSVRSLREALDEVFRDEGLPIPPIWDIPIIRPDWDNIPLNRPHFVGKVNGVSLRARLPRSRNAVPDYRIVWIGRSGRESDPMPILGNPIGLNLSYARPLWDWLFARRLTLLCQAGAGTWPDPNDPPIVLNGEWHQPGRPL